MKAPVRCQLGVFRVIPDCSIDSDRVLNDANSSLYLLIESSEVVGTEVTLLTLRL